MGKLYREFLALLAAADQKARRQLAATAAKHGGLIWAVDALQPEGSGSLLYVLYEVLGGTPLAAVQLEQATAEQLALWLEPYQKLPFTALATLSDGEDTIIAALKRCWPAAPHQRCQTHFLNNLVAPVLEVDAQLRQALQNDIGGLPPVAEHEMAASELGTDSSFVVCRGSAAGSNADRPGEADSAGHP